MPPEAPLTKIAQQAWKPFLPTGAWAIDATAGNGHDSEYLARAVGPEGRIFAFDIQEAALKATAHRLESAGISSRVTLIRADHARMSEYLPCATRGRMNLICFNLGYLPNGDHCVTTRKQSTIDALQEALLLMKPSGILSVIAYRGHEGALEESEAVETFFRTLPAPWKCLRHTETGGTKRPGPVWWLAGQEQ